MAKFIQIMASVPSRGDGKAIASRLVGKGLAACVQILGPIDSTFVWKGKWGREKEWICLIKTKGSLYKKVEREIRSFHKYEVPEILSFGISEGYPPYLKWIGKSTR